MTRARLPDGEGFVDRDGVRIAWETFGAGEPTILFVPTWSIVHSRVWKLQVPYFARKTRVVTFDPRGNGRSDRPTSVAAYAETEFADDILAVMDATATQRAILVSLSMGAQRSLLAAAEHPDRVDGAVFIGPSLPLGALDPARASVPFDDELPTDDGWAKYNRHYWLRDYAGFLEFFFGESFNEPHSTKPIEDCIGWGLEIDPRTLIATHEAPRIPGRERTLDLAGRVRCPVLVIHGEADRIRPLRDAEELAEATHGRFVTIEGGGHLPHVRDPVAVNLLIGEFVRSVARRTAMPSVPTPRKRHARAVA